jgi:hypothetical protein
MSLHSSPFLFPLRSYSPSIPNSVWERLAEKLRFESKRGHETEFRGVRSQTEFGNEGGIAARAVSV